MHAGGKSGVKTTVETYVWVEKKKRKKKNTERTEVTDNLQRDEVHLVQVIRQGKKCMYRTYEKAALMVDGDMR